MIVPLSELKDTLGINSLPPGLEINSFRHINYSYDEIQLQEI